MFAISPTDKDWINYLSLNGYNSYVNFWTPTPWNLKGLNTGTRLYFMLKAPIRKIGGFGELFEYKNLTVNEAWREFGYRNGRESKEDFVNSIQDYIDKNSKKLGRNSIDVESYEIGCIVLKNCQFLTEDKYLSIEDYNIDFASQIVMIKYYNQYDPFVLDIENSNEFSLVTEPREQKKGLTNLRDGQSQFKGLILKAYNNKCCISNEGIPELLEAAHIQPYLSNESNHVQNGLLLRVDLHKLYDADLLFIDSDYIIHISTLIKSEYYLCYDKKRISLPENENDYPSKLALESRRYSFRK